MDYLGKRLSGRNNHKMDIGGIMTKKYIIKNCPAFIEYENAEDKFVRACVSPQNTAYIVHFCKDTNCLLKQIVEKCKDVSGYSDFAFGQRDKADDILSMLEIEECEE